MLAIDANLIVRYLVRDDPGQADAARRIIDRHDTFVASTVILETEWVLRSIYGFSASDCARALTKFAGLPHVAIDDPATVAKALDMAKGGLDFADALHLAKSRDCETFVTFDQDLVKTAKRIGVKVRTPA
ncbi:MAG: type II toxin-antitoxin system VapC family toxin [Alphaproteobacteria bacterium]|nr:type II toxin-antitoxin system VapC family toxin [Alphaproteobacteria bacterium]